jgi:uracil-DNA glycosylase
VENSEKISPSVEPSWLEKLSDEFNAEYFFTLKQFLLEEKKHHTIYPPGKLIFSAFNHTSFDEVNVVIIGQDPYHGPGQANGLCFSVSDGIKHPPSLKNIFKELQSDLGLPYPTSGNLEPWAKQGVLLLNATLTVRRSEAGSHQGKGWETFTDAVIKKLSDEKTGLVFLLWGRFAQNKATLIDATKHHILKAAHPSPFSAYNGFFGCKHFSKTNELLAKQGKTIIDWKIV